MLLPAMARPRRVGPQFKPRARTPLGRLRVRRRLSMEEAARRTDCSRTYWARVEAGLNWPSLDMIRRIARTLRCPARRVVAAFIETQTEDGLYRWG